MAAVEIKRKWKEVDWVVVMAAQSFVAVFAAGPDDEQSDEGGDSKAKAKKTKAGKKKASASAKKMKAPPVSTRALRRRGAKRAMADAEAEEGGDGDGDGAEGGAEDAKQKEEEKESTQAAGFWLAELQDDDVTEEMLERVTGVRIARLNQRPHAPARYDYAYDDIIDVQSLLCHVCLREWGDGSFELTPKSLKRVQRSLARSRRDVTDENNDRRGR
ncbi:hypothetical protein P43SY_010341 [Pythium insidiosum]|uniref:Uncharacterized protein n=1 Tax=Pythium insidiosum TaxID=114742 RepID=A0AAD5Q1L2_PYTIN|nr:hypothetical protein P43SY_010341 [Pythium insidiosum]